jgi:hypothetical protein
VLASQTGHRFDLIFILPIRNQDTSLVGQRHFLH